MRENVLRAGWLTDVDAKPAPALDESIFEPAEVCPDQVCPDQVCPDKVCPVREWSPEDFAREQIRGLVRQVFLGNAFLGNASASPGTSSSRPIRQVVFSSVDREVDLHGICRRVGDALAQETDGTVGVLAGDVRSVIDPEARRGPASQRRSEQAPGMPLRRIGTRVRANFWLVPPLGGESVVTASSLHSYVGEMRREFDYSIIETPPAGQSNDAIAMAQFAEGIILVLSAHRTRRVTARKVKEMLEGAQVRILGTVLSERLFPIPNKIYRRL